MCDAVLASLTALYEGAGQHHYGAAQAGSDLALAASSDASLLGDGPSGVTFLAHALQCAAAAQAAHPQDDELIAAALLHDIGWLLPRPPAGALLTAAAPGTAGSAEAVFIARHDVTGAAHLRGLGFPARVCALVAGHVAAKRYLVATEPAYAQALSPGSRWTLAQQGGPMAPAEAAAFAAHALTPLCLALRRWDEAAKVPGLATPPWAAFAPHLARALASPAAAHFAPFASPALPQALRLGAVAPLAATSPLAASGPGYAVVRAWLAPSEIAALRAYAEEVPAMPADRVFHTYERNGQGAVVTSRSEHFAHVEDAGGVGAFLREGRLRELCCALREGRGFGLYKEKINYKLRGRTGGYKPHVDFYSKINRALWRGARRAGCPLLQQQQARTPFTSRPLLPHKPPPSTPPPPQRTRCSASSCCPTATCACACWPLTTWTRRMGAPTWRPGSTGRGQCFSRARWTQ